MNRGIEDLIAEREQVRSAVERFAPATAAWAFEAEPASAKPLLDFYIEAVKISDLFRPCARPTPHKASSGRIQCGPGSRQAHSGIQQAGSFERSQCRGVAAHTEQQVRAFTNAVELGEKVRRALGFHMLSLIRGDASARIQPGDGLARLRAHAREGVGSDSAHGSAMRIQLVSPVRRDSNHRYLPQGYRTGCLGSGPAHR